MSYLGLGKTLYHSGACILNHEGIELSLVERLSRKKNDGAWPMLALQALGVHSGSALKGIAETRDVLNPLDKELLFDQAYPFFDHLQAKKMALFSRKFNSDLQFVTHHRAHALAAMVLSPFERAIILVVDGAGSESSDFENPEFLSPNGQGPWYEHTSIYLKDKGQLTCLHKEWLRFEKREHGLPRPAEGIGTYYEQVSKLIFEDNMAAGKTMGLAAFQKGAAPESAIAGELSLNWNKSANKLNKTQWEQSPHKQYWITEAANVQAYFETNFERLIKLIQQLCPEEKNLILAGGCALNCTMNGKLLAKNIFDGLYVLPFPGDEGVSLGCAAHLYLRDNPEGFKPWSWETQTSSFGPKSSLANLDRVPEIFKDYNVSPITDWAEVSSDIANGKIVAWFQGRSECGPRALGHRSILARADLPGIKDKLNSTIKFRESFRPYGATVLWERAHEYFEIKKGFYNPFMSYAIPVKSLFKERLKEISHVDGTCRMQTLTKEENAPFHEILRHLHRLTGLAVVLNTSLNVMGEPIVETVEDALRFMHQSPVDALAIGNYYVTRR
jgi:carbamoyltransferase